MLAANTFDVDYKFSIWGVSSLQRRVCCNSNIFSIVNLALTRQMKFVSLLCWFAAHCFHQTWTHLINSPKVQTEHRDWLKASVNQRNPNFIGLGTISFTGTRPLTHSALTGRPLSLRTIPGLPWKSPPARLPPSRCPVAAVDAADWGRHTGGARGSVRRFSPAWAGLLLLFQHCEAQGLESTKCNLTYKHLYLQMLSCFSSELSLTVSPVLRSAEPV